MVIWDGAPAHERGNNRHIQGLGKFHQQIRVIDEWAVGRLAMPMSAEDQISAFLKTIPKDCKNGELMIAKGIIEGD